METHKSAKPHFSQACDRLYERVKYLIGESEQVPTFAYNDMAEARRRQMFNGHGEESPEQGSPSP